MILKYSELKSPQDKITLCITKGYTSAYRGIQILSKKNTPHSDVKALSNFSQFCYESSGLSY